MFYPVIEVLASFLEEFFLLSIGGLFFERRIKSKWYWANLLVCCAIFTGMITYLNGIVLYSYATLAIGLLGSVLINLVLHRCNVVRACCLSTLYMVIVSSFDFLFLIFVEYGLKAPEFVQAVLIGNCVERVITLVISKSSLAVAFLFIKITKWKVNVSITTSLILIVFAVLSFASMQYLIEMFFMSELREVQEVILVAGAFMTLFFFSILLIINGQENMRRKVKEKELIESELRITKERNEGIIETYREISKVAHDFKNQMRITELMLTNGKITEACDYLSGIVESSAYKMSEYTGISSIDTVLSEKARVAAERNVQMDFDVSLSSTNNVDPTDICTILLNLIDNAIEASLKIEDQSSKKVKIVLKNVNSMILIKIENTVLEDIVIENKFSILKTSKRDKESHGLGLKIVKSVAEKYNGSLALMSKNNCFTATVLLCN